VLAPGVGALLHRNMGNESMRVAYLINQYPKVSHSFIRREILALERRGFEVMRIALRGWDGEVVDAEDEIERERTRYVLSEGAPPLLLALTRTLFTRPMRLGRALALAWRMGRHADRPLPVHLAYLAEACRIEPWLREAGIQHLHAHFGTNSAEVAMLVRALGGPEWSFTVHGPEEFDRGHHIGLAEKIRHCGFVAAVSSFGRSQLYRFVDHQQWRKVQVVHCGLELSFLAAPLSPVPAVRRFICVGRLCEQKGQLLLVEAVARLAAQGQDFQLVLAGDGEMRAEIEAMVAHHKLEAHVRITGWISGEQVRAEILAARALVLPSFAEGLPVVIVEAMALGRPVISTFVAGIPELVYPGEHGWLVPAGDVDELVRAMQACLEAPTDTLTSMGSAGRKQILARHNVDTEAVKLAGLFERLAKPRTTTFSSVKPPSKADA
jgi:colanic acid/amylovoran biosynthesis glycosyltransferase